MFIEKWNTEPTREPIFNSCLGTPRCKVFCEIFGSRIIFMMWIYFKRASPSSQNKLGHWRKRWDHTVNSWSAECNKGWCNPWESWVRKYRKCTGSQESADIAVNGTDEMSLKKKTKTGAGQLYWRKAAGKGPRLRKEWKHIQGEKVTEVRELDLYCLRRGRFL